MPSQLSLQWLSGNSCTWAHVVWLHIAGTNEPKSAQQAEQDEHSIYVIMKTMRCMYICL